MEKRITDNKLLKMFADPDQNFDHKIESKSFIADTTPDGRIIKLIHKPCLPKSCEGLIHNLSSSVIFLREELLDMKKCIFTVSPANIIHRAFFFLYKEIKTHGRNEVVWDMSCSVIDYFDWWVKTISLGIDIKNGLTKEEYDRAIETFFITIRDFLPKEETNHIISNLVSDFDEVKIDRLLKCEPFMKVFGDVYKKCLMLNELSM